MTIVDVTKPDSIFHVADFIGPTSIWREINLVNLQQNILGTRERATVILRKGPDHAVEQVKLRRTDPKPVLVVD